jgi:hypothetical protein
MVFLCCQSLAGGAYGWMKVQGCNQNNISDHFLQHGDFLKGKY